jgi:hypothetical protein
MLLSGLAFLFCGLSNNVVFSLDYTAAHDKTINE